MKILSLRSVGWDEMAKRLRCWTGDRENHQTIGVSSAQQTEDTTTEIESPTVTLPGKRINTGYINSIKGNILRGTEGLHAGSNPVLRRQQPSPPLFDPKVVDSVCSLSYKAENRDPVSVLQGV